MTHWMQRFVVRHLVPRRRLVKLLEAERKWRLASTATLLKLHAQVVTANGERDDAQTALAEIKRSGYAGPGYAIVRLTPDDHRVQTSAVATTVEAERCEECRQPITDQDTVVHRGGETGPGGSWTWVVHDGCNDAFLARENERATS